MGDSSLKEKTAQGLFWGGFSNGLQQLLNLLFGIVLARLLDVSDYGMIGMLTIFSAIASALQEGGFVAALTNRKEVRHEDYNAVFWFSSLCGVILYGVLFFAAPLIADFYNTPVLVPLSRISFLGFLISSMSIAPRAYLFKNLKIKETTVISVSSLLVSGIVGILLAANGFAYWGIAIQSISFVTVMTLLNFYFSHWRPSFQFDFRPVREMIGFSSKLIITNIFNIINNNLFSVLLGKFYSEREVGNFTQANKWNGMGHTLITGMIGGIAQPVFISVCEDKERQLNVFRKMLRFTAFVSFPAMFGLSLVSKELIVITITEKWLESAYILRILCIWGAFIPIINLFSNLIISRGRSSVYMWNTICLSVLQLFAVCGMYPYGMKWMLGVFVLINIGWLFVWFVFVKKEIGLRLCDMLKDMTPYFVLSIGLVIGAYYIALPIENLYLSMAVKIMFVAGFYALILWKLQSVIFKECIEFLLRKKSMSRIAYLLSAYKDAPHLARLVAALDEDADFYVHIDLKADIRPFKELLEDKVVFVPRHWVGWGGWGQVEYQQELLGAALRSGVSYARVVCLSGQDYPLWSNEKIHRFFEENSNIEFIMGMNLTLCTDKSQLAKIVNYHFFRDLPWASLWWKSKLVVISRNLMKRIPVRKKPMTTLDGREVDVFFGSDYWAITLPCARYVFDKLCSEKEMRRYFKTSYVPSELCIQTIVFNSPFGRRALLHEGGYPGLSGLTPLHYITYGKSIKILTADDLSVLEQSGKPFCRKVVSGASDTFVLEISRIRNSLKPSSSCMY